tara:strand:- start:39 stop:1049 length:1011 start_codon:yes stop_codon:yes gene_type:complete
MRKSKLQAFHEKVHTWYAQHGRQDLPWRKTDDAYAIWISEVMLQQTQVKTVLARFYYPFLKRFPSLQSLAEASEEAVLKQWQGLGYYSRARNLHRAAQLASPALPNHFDGLIALPGIGKNTANAVLAFGFHQPVAILEANVKRVVARIAALETPTDAELWQQAERLLDPTHPFDYNQAMMDLGALVCTPKAPDCAICPANNICEGKHDPARYPQKRVRKAVPTREMAILIEEDSESRIFVQARNSRFLGGLYGMREWPKESFIPEANDRQLGAITHIYSHFRLEAEIWYRRYSEPRNSPDWVERKTLTQLPLSQADIKALTVAWPDFRPALPHSEA